MRTRTFSFHFAFCKIEPLKQPKRSLLTTDGDVAELHADRLVQREAPGGLVLVARVTAVRVSSVQLRVADGQVGVAVRILGVPRLTLAA